MASKTALALVVDRSGSMRPIANVTTDALQEFLNSQKEIDGDLSISTVFFDTEIEKRDVFVDPRTTEVDLEIYPRGMTALFDAIGTTVSIFSENIAKLDEDKKPDVVIVVIATDGLENSSKEYTRDKIAEIIKEKQNEGWKFVFLAANQDAVLTAEGLNIGNESALTYSANAAGVSSVMRSASKYVSNVRAYKQAGFTDSDREQSLKD